MRRSAALALALVFAFAACDDKEDPTGGANSCLGLSGNYVASTFTATGTSNTSLSNNFLSNGGSFSLTFLTGSFTSRFTPSTGAATTTRTGVYTTAGTSTASFGGQPLFTGVVGGAQQYTCAESNGTLTLNANTLYAFGTDTTHVPAKINIVLNKTTP
jgi:hypothetical protein